MVWAVCAYWYSISFLVLILGVWFLRISAVPIGYGEVWTHFYYIHQDLACAVVARLWSHLAQDASVEHLVRFVPEGATNLLVLFPGDRDDVILSKLYCFSKRFVSLISH